jgi:hypothetical protein
MANEAEATEVRTEKGRVPQLDLFDSLFPQDRSHPYSNTFALYDLAPKYVFGSEDRKDGIYLPIRQCEFEHRQTRYEVEVRPARLRIMGPDGVEVEREYYPGEREQVVEEALRRIAIEKHRTEIFTGVEKTPQVGLRFSLYELRQELIRVGHGFRIDEIKQAIEICALSNVTIRLAGERKPLVSASIFPVRAVNEQQSNGDVVSWVTFNPLVTDAMLRFDYRLYNYETSMRLTSSVARWLHKRLAHNYTQASSTEGYYGINATTIMRDCGMGRYARDRDRFRAVSDAIAELKRVGILNVVKPTEERGPRRKLVEVRYMLFPSHEFTKEMKQANWMKGRVDEESVKRGFRVHEGGAAGAPKPALPAPSGRNASSSVFSPKRDR